MKRILSLALAVIMIAAMAAVIVVPTSAEEAPATTYASSYKGTEDISWYGYIDEEEGIAKPHDATKTEYHITNADGLAGLAYLVGYEFIDFEGVTIKLDCDVVWNAGKFTMDETTYEPLYDGKPVDENNYVNKWTPIGDRGNAYESGGRESGQFRGSFDGQGHVVSGLYVNDNKVNAGFFTVFCGREL